MLNELMARLFGGAGLALLLLLAGLATPALAVPEKPEGYWTCVAIGCTPCTSAPPCQGVCASCTCNCNAWIGLWQCDCGTD
ncbi:MAG: hypothetical protein U0746_22810 [Gemmataceae bacterium]